eukprot:gene10074-7971_t
MVESPLKICLAGIPTVKAADGFIQTEKFLDVCRTVLPVVDRLGTAFSLVRGDINGNITRLADRSAKDPLKYSRLFAIVQDEIVHGTEKGSSSCAKGLLWLKRAMEFVVAILRKTCEDKESPMTKVVTDTYTATLYQFHGFMVSSAFTLAFKFVPSREYFLENLGPSDDIYADILALADAFEPILKEIHYYLVESNLNDPTKV